MVDPLTPPLVLSRAEILAFRRRVGALDERLPPGRGSLRQAAWAGLQDSMPRAALLSIHARVAGAGPSSWEDASVVQLYYYLFLALVVVIVFFCIRLQNSRIGRAWVAIREDEIAASAMGIPLMRTKTLAYAIGAFFGGGAGCFYAIYKNSTFPGDFSLNISITVLCMVILGGMGNVWGVCLGGAVLSYLNYQGLEAVGNNFNNIAGTSLNVPQYTYGIFGLIIVVMMLLRPEGLIPGRRRRIELELGVEGGSLYEAEMQ